MKTDSGINRKLAIVALAFTLAFSTPTMANDGGDKENPSSELKFIGNVEDQPVFELNLGNEDEYTVIFRDETGNILYTDKFKGNLTKKFLLKSDEGDATVSVVVRSRKTNATEVYSINRSHSYVEETVINKLN
jgi:hypothetical protein